MLCCRSISFGPAVSSTPSPGPETCLQGARLQGQRPASWMYLTSMAVRWKGSPSSVVIHGGQWGKQRTLGETRKRVCTPACQALASLRLYLTMCVHAPGLRIVGGMRGASGSFSYSSELSRGNILHQKPYTITEFLQEVKPEGAS